MHENDLNQKLKSLIIKNSIVKITNEDIKNNSDLINDFGFDSIRIMQFIMEIEKEFNIKFQPNELVLDTVGNYGQLLIYLKNK